MSLKYMCLSSLYVMLIIWDTSWWFKKKKMLNRQVQNCLSMGCLYANPQNSKSHERAQSVTCSLKYNWKLKNYIHVSYGSHWLKLRILLRCFVIVYGER